MAFAMPSYIERAGIAGSPIVHTWDDNDPAFAYLGENYRLRERLSGLSDRAVLAYCAGCAEWVWWRFASASTDSTLAQVIEAVWAGIVDWRYLRFDELPRHPVYRSHPEWQGAVRGPMRAAAGLLREAVDLIWRQNTFAHPEAVCLAYLTRLVLPDVKPFQKWQRATLRRLEHWYPPQAADRFGAPVPRQAVDPEDEFDIAHADRMLADFLQGLDPTNPYVQPITIWPQAAGQHDPTDPA